MESRLQEINYAVLSGATEIDVVLDRSLVLTGQWDLLYHEVQQMRKACGKAHLKVILGVGELGSYENVSFFIEFIGNSFCQRFLVDRFFFNFAGTVCAFAE